MAIGPDALMSSGGGVSLIPGGNAMVGLGRFASPTRRFLLNRRKWWCCGAPKRRKSSMKANTVSLNSLIRHQKCRFSFFDDK